MPRARLLLTVTTLLLAPLSALDAAHLTLTAPLDYQVIQRKTKDTGRITISGALADADTTAVEVEARIVAGGHVGQWRKLDAKFTGKEFEADLEAPSGGWYRLEVRAIAKGREKALAEAAVGHLGVGEVFVVAGQSNAANYGEEKQSTKTEKVTTFDGKRWQLSKDPQPGAGGSGGSFMPIFGDLMVKRFDVPVGIIACGIGSTSVREWLPNGTRIANPPTLTGRVQQLPSGEWEAKGEVYQKFVARMKPLGPHGFRAVLWHQGESDANQKDQSRTLPGKLYREYLEKLIRDSRRELGWEAPWFVAQVSYHSPSDAGSADIRAAQASLWKDGVAFEGPDTDTFKGEWREKSGKGVHFSGAGLRKHAEGWVERVGPWVEGQVPDFWSCAQNSPWAMAGTLRKLATQQLTRNMGQLMSGLLGWTPGKGWT